MCVLSPQKKSVTQQPYFLRQALSYLELDDLMRLAGWLAGELLGCAFLHLLGPEIIITHNCARFLYADSDE